MKRAIVLSLVDLKNISRDPMLMMVFIAPVLIAVALRFGLPFAAGVLQEKLAFDLRVHYPFILSMAIPFIPMLIGIMVGFIILEEQDENLMAYFSVTPVSRAGYLMYRITAPALLSFFFSVFMVWTIDLIPINYLSLIPVIFTASLEAPMMALFLGVFAANRIEGLALSKALGIFLMAPLPGYLVKFPWQLLAGVFPAYWVSKSFLASFEADGLFGVYTVMGLFIHVSYIYLLLERFKQKAI